MSAEHGLAGTSPAPPGQAAAAPGGPPGPVRRGEAVRVALHSVGCKLNSCEMEALASSLQRRGFQVVEFGAPADVCIVNTCTVTAAGEADSRRAVRRARRSSPGGTVLATGCCAQRQPNALYDAGASLVVGNADKAGIPELLAGSGSSGPPGPGAGKPLPLGVPACRPVVTRFLHIEGPVPGGRTRGMLQVQDGCDEHCSYCVVPQVRGPSVSRSPAEVIAQAERMADLGYRELALTGVHTGSYGADLGGWGGLPELLARLERVPGIVRLRLNSIEPAWLSDELIALLAASERICHHLHVPLQSGADAVLRAMGRRYTAAQYAARVERAAAALPDCAIGADVMVGFPAEGDAEFAQTCSLLASLPFSYLHVFTYSRRAGTAAARLRPQSSAGERRARARRLIEFGAARREAFHRRFLGRAIDVLVEDRPDPGTGRSTGLTGNYIRAVFDGPGMANRTVAVHVTKASAWGVEGEVASGSVTPPPGGAAPADATPLPLPRRPVP